MISKSKKSVIEELKRNIDELNNKLLDVLDNWHYYQNDVYQEIMFRYDNIFGDLEDEIDNKSQAVSELERKLELLKLKMRKGERINASTVRFINLIVSREISRASAFSTPVYQKIQCDKPADLSANEKLKQLSCEVNDNYELPQLYRNLVKKLHPDVSGESEKFERFWENIQQAYRSRDVDRLRLLNLTLCDTMDFDNVDNKNAEIALKTRIYELEQSIRRQEIKLNTLKRQEPFSFESKLADRFWVAKRKNQLREKIFQIDNKLQHHNKLLSSLVSDSSKEKSDLFKGSRAV